MPPSRLFHSRAPVCIPLEHFSSPVSSFRERDSGYRRVAIGTGCRPGHHFSNLSAYIAPDISRSLSSRKNRAPTLSRHSIRSPVGCLISHPLDTFFIVRLTISDNARPRGVTGETKESATTARPIRDLLTNVRKPARIDIGSPRSRYTSTINHISR